jgi:hypothetical protein
VTKNTDLVGAVVAVGTIDASGLVCGVAISAGGVDGVEVSPQPPTSSMTTAMPIISRAFRFSIVRSPLQFPVAIRSDQNRRCSRLLGQGTRAQIKPVPAEKPRFERQKSWVTFVSLHGCHVTQGQVLVIDDGYLGQIVCR